MINVCFSARCTLAANDVCGDTDVRVFGTKTIKLIQSQSQSYIITDGQSASLSLNNAPTWGLRQDLYYCQTVAGLLMWGALCDERTGLSFTIAAGPRQRSPWDS
jgi:hypothetical protein